MIAIGSLPSTWNVRRDAGHGLLYNRCAII